MAIREQAGFLPHMEVDFEIDGDAVRIVRAKSPKGESRGERAVRLLRGSGTVRMTTDEIMALMRGDRRTTSRAQVTPVLVDSNVILDVATTDPVWSAWSEAALRRLADETSLVINPLIYAEVSVRYETVEELETVVPAELFQRDHLPFEAALLAGKCFRAYRSRGGARTSPLPDFYIGAHAAVCGYRLLTRDAVRYRSYFPSVELIAPRIQ